jgi:hypothetical protein
MDTSGIRLPVDAHTARPWRIHEVTGDFRVEDVWALPTPGGPDDFGRLVQLMTSLDPADSSSVALRGLFAIRWKLGGLLGLDRPETGLGARVGTLRDRLPADLLDAPRRPGSDLLPFSPLYLTDDEWALEMANQTVHGVLHVGWVRGRAGAYHGQMAVLVRPNGLLGTGYMAAIAPFRHWIVYPLMMRDIGRAWRGGDPLCIGRDAAIDLLDRLHSAQNEFYTGGSSAALRRLLSPDVTWTVPGDNAIAGSYHGLPEVLEYFRRRRDFAGSTVWLSRRDVLVGDGARIAALTDGFATIAGVDHRWSTVGLYDVADQRVAAGRLLPLDQRAFDAIWSS